MHGLFYFFQISLPRVLGNDDVRAKGNPYKERNEKPDDRRIAADGGHGFLTNKTPHDDDVDGIEKLLADPCDRQKYGERNRLVAERPMEHVHFSHISVIPSYSIFLIITKITK